MNKDINENCSTLNWYPHLANYTFPTSFVKLKDHEVQALAEGKIAGDEVKGIISRMALPLSFFPGNCFVFTNLVAPTDTVRFAKKRGAVYSAKSAWRFLAESEKIRTSAKSGMVSHICIRPFRRMNKTREFRLFVHKSKLKAMSQYWLIRHFRRLEGIKNTYWEAANDFVDEISWALPLDTIVIDIYFTSDGKILIIDLNPWGGETNPLLLKQWEQDWESVIGIKLIPSPTKISGNVNVSF